MSNYSDSLFSKDKNSSWYKIFTAIKPGSKVLDVGCSSGNFGKVLIDEKKCIVHGIEIDPSDFAEAKTKLQKVFSYNIETDKLSGLDKDYDYIYFGDVIEHLMAPSKSLKRIAPYLKTDGKLLFSVPNMTHGLVRLMLLQGKFEYGETGLLDKTHMHFYDYDLLQAVLNDGGFEIVKIDPVKKDLPEVVIKQELAKVGLKLTPAFMEFMRSAPASSYQFVGAAQKTTTKPKPKNLELSSPVDIFQVYLDNTTRYYEDTIKALKEQITALRERAKKYDELEVEYQAAIAQLKAIHESKTWKLANGLSRAKQKVTRAK